MAIQSFTTNSPVCHSRWIFGKDLTTAKYSSTYCISASTVPVCIGWESSPRIESAAVFAARNQGACVCRTPVANQISEPGLWQSHNWNFGRRLVLTQPKLVTASQREEQDWSSHTVNYCCLPVIPDGLEGAAFDSVMEKLCLLTSTMQNLMFKCVSACWLQSYKLNGQVLDSGSTWDSKTIIIIVSRCKSGRSKEEKIATSARKESGKTRRGPSPTRCKSGRK